MGFIGLEKSHKVPTWISEKSVPFLFIFTAILTVVDQNFQCGPALLNTAHFLQYRDSWLSF